MNTVVHALIAIAAAALCMALAAYLEETVGAFQQARRTNRISRRVMGL
jgi:hypothetical protein